MWYGHTFKRWASFTQNNPTENLLKIKHPVYIAVSANDKNTSVLGTDYMYLACIQRGKNNVTYKVYPYDHYFNEEIVDQEGKINKIHKMKEVFDEAFNWLDKH
jgi:dipeptidyl aminopeptidase/acylaminoacyl peptidase